MPIEYGLTLRRIVAHGLYRPQRILGMVFTPAICQSASTTICKSADEGCENPAHCFQMKELFVTMVFEKCNRYRENQKQQQKKTSNTCYDSSEDEPPNSRRLSAPPASTAPRRPMQHFVTVPNDCHTRPGTQNCRGEIKQEQDPADLSGHEIRVHNPQGNYLNHDLIDGVPCIPRTQNPPPAPSPSLGATDKRKRGRCSSPVANAADTSNAAAASGKAYRSGPTAPKRRRLGKTTTCTSSLTMNIALGNHHSGSIPNTAPSSSCIIQPIRTDCQQPSPSSNLAHTDKSGRSHGDRPGGEEHVHINDERMEPTDVLTQGHMEAGEDALVDCGETEQGSIQRSSHQPVKNDESGHQNALGSTSMCRQVPGPEPTMLSGQRINLRCRQRLAISTLVKMKLELEDPAGVSPVKGQKKVTSLLFPPHIQHPRIARKKRREAMFLPLRRSS